MSEFLTGFSYGLGFAALLAICSAVFRAVREIPGEE